MDEPQGSEEGDRNIEKCYSVMQMDKYEIILYWSEEDKVFIAEVPELPGCIAHGESQELALANAKEAIRLWIDTAREFGDPVPAPKGQRLMFA